MKGLAFLCFGALLCLSHALEEKKSYAGYQVLQTAQLNREQAALLHELQYTNFDLDFWHEPQPFAEARVMAGPHLLENLKQMLGHNGIEYSVMYPDVEEAILKLSGRSQDDREGPAANPRYSLDWKDYYGHDTINEFIDELASQYEWVNTVSIGETYEGRDQRVIQITKAGPGKPNAWFEAGMHAREWIGPAVATYIIRELVENYDQHADIVDNVNIHFIPLANPDGYEYSRSVDRLWRKTRSDTGSAQCKGVDANRNFDHHFGESGVSSNKCSSTYNGPRAFSEIETANIRDYVNALDPVPVIGKSLHSAAEILLYPYGYDYNVYPDNKDEIVALGDDGVDALNAVHGMSFRNIETTDLYPCSGTSHDWYAGIVGMRFAYTLELRDQGYGFLLPTEQIIPSGEETWAMYEVIFNKIIEVSKE